MGLIVTWSITYLAPATAAWVATRFFTSKVAGGRYNQVAIHAALLISIFMSQYAIHRAGLVFPWSIDLASALALAAAAIAAFLFIGPIGLWYAVSAFMQSVTMFSIAFLLLPAFPLYAVVLLITPLFVLAHFISLERWRLRALLLSAWGIASIALFAWTQNVYIVAALHAALGSFFISRTILSIGRGREHLVKSWLG